MKRNILNAVHIAIFTALSLSMSAQLQTDLMYWRPNDQRGVNTFEDPKVDTSVFEGISVRVGGAFAQQYQMLSHENGYTPGDTITPQLYDLSDGFNLATANLNIGAQLADGIRLELVTYLSSRHHPEAWVKGGYIQFDKLEFLGSDFIDNLMEVLRIRIGHMEINYGDAHFRRTDNGNAFYNPWVGNLIMDGFNTEIGAEIYYMSNGWLGMVGITGGEIKGDVSTPPTIPGDDKAKRSPSILLKIGYDNGASGSYSGNVRFRITGSLYTTASSRTNHLYSGDRGGSRYYLVLEEMGASAGSNFTSGRYNPGFRDKVTSFMINPFVQFGGLEFFGTFEQSNGRSAGEADTRSATQIAAELLYRFGGSDNFYIGGKYNTVSSEDGQAVDEKITINRYAIAGGWYVTRNILFKVEYVNQEHKDYVQTSRFYEGKYNGLMIEAVVAF